MIEFWVRYSNFGSGIIGLQVSMRMGGSSKRKTFRRACSDYARMIEAKLPPAVRDVPKRRDDKDDKSQRKTHHKWRCSRCNRLLTVRTCLECDMDHRTVSICPEDVPYLDHMKGPSKPCVETKHKPGTREKLDVLQARVANGEELYHEQDAQLEVGDPTGSARGFYGS